MWWLAAKSASGELAGHGVWSILGFLGSFLIGVGLFNFVAILLRQHLGHLISILCFLIGGALVAISGMLLL